LENTLAKINAVGSLNKDKDKKGDGKDSQKK